MNSSVWFTAALCLGLTATAEAQNRGRIRFQELDLNGDRIITRDEWRGNDRSFRNQDWNGDGQLSGIELRIGAQRPVRDPELIGTSGAQDRFDTLDKNRDGRIARGEWTGTAAVFNALDANGDGLLTRVEATGADAAVENDEFRAADLNGDGFVGRSEWQWNAAAFDRLDINRDGRLARAEFNPTQGVIQAPPPPVPQVQTAAYRAGFERGRQEGIQAGREDKPRGWDLEGQRELESADSGYEPRLGERAEYQAGYRTGFRRGYREGFGPR